MITKRIQRRNANILKYHERGYDTRTIGKIFHLSHAQCANIIKKLKEQEKAELKEDELNAREVSERNVQNYMDHKFQDEEEAACRNER